MWFVALTVKLASVSAPVAAPTDGREFRQLRSAGRGFKELRSLASQAFALKAAYHEDATAPPPAISAVKRSDT